MEIKELLGFVKEERRRLMEFYNLKDKKEIKYPMALKIMEEIGELSQEVLASDSLQRSEKLSTKSKLEEEFADVIITTLLLAENMDVDIKEALKNKIKKIKERIY